MSQITQTTKQLKKEEELQKRVDSFNAEVTPLLAKYNLALAAQPIIAPNGLVVARPILVDADDLKKDQPAPSAEKDKKDLAEA
jgi:hypothetical protein